MNKLKVKVIEGFDKIKEYYYSINSELSKDEEVLIFGARSGNPHFQNAIDFFVQYIHHRSQQGIKTKILYNLDVQSLGKVYESIPLVQVRYMPMGLITQVGVNIYRDTIDMLDWSNPMDPQLVVIEDKHIAESYREYFYMLWSATVAILELEKKGNFYLPEILFENFIQHSDEKEKVEKEILNTLNKYKPKSFLNIGSGFDTLSQDKDFPNSIEQITLIEKNTSYVQSYLDTKTKVIHQDFELWEGEEKYDVILASHVLFYFKDKKAALEKVLSHLNPGGVALFVLHEPSKDYKKIKDFVFGIIGKKYFYTYDTFCRILVEKECTVEKININCSLKGRTVEELYKAMRLWFEMDLNVFYENEKQVISILKDNSIEYTNTLFIVHKK